MQSLAYCPNFGPAMTSDNVRQLVQQSSNVILATHIEPKDDMVAERARATFSSAELAEYLNGGREKLQKT